MDTQPIHAPDAPARLRPSNYPPEFARRMEGRVKRPLGDLFGLSNFGVNLTTLPPGSISALHHAHSLQDEFIYVLEGELWLVSGDREFCLRPGMCMGFPAKGAPHHLENRSQGPATYLEVGDRSVGDEVSYPADDLVARRIEAGWQFTRKNGIPY
jgi:uncharacterized cupin superfamily protein